MGANKFGLRDENALSVLMGRLLPPLRSRKTTDVDCVGRRIVGVVGVVRTRLAALVSSPKDVVPGREERPASG